VSVSVCAVEVGAWFFGWWANKCRDDDDHINDPWSILL
jgi:nitrogen fixation-related uncharacterized protein